jgi:hypothetical protein
MAVHYDQGAHVAQALARRRRHRAAQIGDRIGCGGVGRALRADQYDRPARVPD